MSYCAVYLNRIHREKNLPEKPEDPLVLEKSIPFDADFTFVDFVPSVLTYSSSSPSGVEYHRFSHLVEAANEWMKKNSHWNIINCETVLLAYRHNVTSMVSRWEQQINPVTPLWSPIYRGEFETVLKAFRLWIQRKDNDETPNSPNLHMKLKYIDFIPKRLNENSFETIDDLLTRINVRLKQPDTLLWNIITIESLKIESNSEWTIDSEISLAEESSRQLTILRLFYEVNTSNNIDYLDSILFRCKDNTGYTVIGVQDFKPRLISAGSFFKKPEFESFSSLVQRASVWLAVHTEAHFLNAQSIDIKIKSLTKFETRNCTNIEHGDYIQFLRIIYCKIVLNRPINTDNEIMPDRETKSAEPTITEQDLASESYSTTADSIKQFDYLRFSSKVFVATKLDHPLDSIQQRIHNWLHLDIKQNICILSAETVNIYATDDDERVLEKKTGECFQGNRLGSLNTYKFKAVRVYYCILPHNPNILSGTNVFEDNQVILANYNAANCSKTFPLQRRILSGSRRSQKANTNVNNMDMWRRKSSRLKPIEELENSPLQSTGSTALKFNPIQLNEEKCKLTERRKLAKQESSISFIKNFGKSNDIRNRSTSCNCM